MGVIAMRIQRALPAVVAALIATLPLGAQVVAHQGEKAQAPDVQEFPSPMVLELPLELDRLPERSVRDLAQLSRYWCEDAHLVGVKLTAVKLGKKESRFEVSGFVQVRESYDRLASVRVELSDGQKAIAGASDDKIDAEEGKSRPFRVRLVVPEEKMQLLRQVGGAAKLILTLTLRNNS
jgi:hypothetical protein